MGSYLLVKCECGSLNTVFKFTKLPVSCPGCGKKVAEPRGGAAKIIGTVEKEFD
ncbi:MAG: 30S ribosomal protein S27e [Candidatus Micrarchaeota archaeon]|nr:30S ribosomal protein S27e [Candidatus Micrarchaeota archaeon]